MSFKHEVMVTAVGTEHTNSTNRFELGRAYPARPMGRGYMVALPGCERFVTADGHGGAHLQHRSGDGWTFRARTEGHFEIETTPA